MRTPKDKDGARKYLSNGREYVDLDTESDLGKIKAVHSRIQTQWKGLEKSVRKAEARQDLLLQQTSKNTKKKAQ